MRQQIDAAAFGTPVPIERARQRRDRALLLQEDLGMPGTAADAHVDPILSPFRRRVTAEVELPSIVAEAPTRTSRRADASAHVKMARNRSLPNANSAIFRGGRAVKLCAFKNDSELYSGARRAMRQTSEPFHQLRNLQ